MNRAPALSGLIAVLIVTLLTSCDNVEWGGAELVVVPPPPRVEEEATAPEEGEETRLPEGPVLYSVRTTDGRAIITPVAEISGDSLLEIRPGEDWERFGRRFISQHLREDAEFALFHAGQRAGTLVIDSAALSDAAACPRLPRATGVPELVAGAAEETEFLALAKPYAPDAPRTGFGALEPDRNMRVLAPILAERLLRARGAPLPGNWSRAMAQLQPFALDDDERLSFAATFLVGDTLGPGLDADGHSLFFIAEYESEIGYDTVYTLFTDYPRAGKAAPGVVDVLDWDRDGAPEMLLRVYGTEAEWFAAVGRTDDGWRSIFQSSCERRSPPPQAPEDTTGAGAAMARRGGGAPARRSVARRRPAPEPVLPEPEIELTVPGGS